MAITSRFQLIYRVVLPDHLHEYSRYFAIHKFSTTFIANFMQEQTIWISQGARCDMNYRRIVVISTIDKSYVL